MYRRPEIYGAAAEDADAVIRRTQPNALLILAQSVPVDKIPATQVKAEVASNVISLAARQESQILAKQAEPLTEQDQRLVDARDATNAALEPETAPDTDKLLEEIGYASAA